MRYSREIVAIIKQIVIVILKHRGNAFLYTLSISSRDVMKLMMCKSVIGGNMLIVLVSLKYDINFKLNRGLNLFKQGSKLYPHSVIGNLLVRVYSWDNEVK